MSELIKKINDIAETFDKTGDSLNENQRALLAGCLSVYLTNLYTQADMDKAIEQAKRETAEKCAEVYIELIKDFKGEIAPCFDEYIKAIKAVGGGDAS